MCSAYDVERLIGIPWGYGPPPESADCISLAVYCQKVLFGNDVAIDKTDLDSFRGKISEFGLDDLRVVLSNFAYPVNNPDKGDVAVIRLGEYGHIATLIDKWHILHILVARKSRVSKLSKWPIDSFWRVRRA